MSGKDLKYGNQNKFRQILRDSAKIQEEDARKANEEEIGELDCYLVLAEICIFESENMYSKQFHNQSFIDETHKRI